MKKFKIPKERKLYQLGIRFWFFVLAFWSYQVVHAQCTLSVNAGNDVAICSGENISLNASSTGGIGTVKYSWTPITGLSKTDIPNPEASPTVSTTYKVTVTDDNCKIADAKTDEVNIAVNPLPVIDFVYTNNNACSGTTVYFTSSATGTGSLSYTWNFGDGITSTDQNPSHVFTSLGCGSATFFVTFTVTDAVGCSNSTTKSVIVKQMPDINFEDVNNKFDPFSNCSFASASNPNYSVTVGNISASACISSYSVNWGDGNSETAISFPISHTYTKLGAYNMVITALGTNGCSNSKTYIIKNVSNPSGGIISPGSTTNLCAPTSDLQFEVSKWGSNSPGTIYEINYGDNSPIVTLTQEQLVSSPYYNALNPIGSANYPIPHSYTKTSCPDPSFIVTLIVTNACGSTPFTAGNISVLNKSAANFTGTTSACVNTSVLFTNNTISGYSQNCSQNSIYTWDFGDGTPVISTLPSSPQNINHIYLNPGNFTVTLTALNFCGSTSKSQQICIESPLLPQFTINNIAGCTPLGVTATNTTDISKACSPPTYSWSVTYANSNCGVSSLYSYTGGTNYSSKDPSFQFTNPGTYTIKLSVTNSCGTKVSGAQTVTVKQQPTVSITAIASICQTLPTTTINPTATAADCGSVPLQYEWSFPGGLTSSIPNPGPISIIGSGTNTVTLKVTNECGSSEAVKIFTINELPEVSGNLSACVGFTSQLTGSATAAVNSPWVSSNTSVATVSATGLVTARSYGTTVITYTNNNGCKIAVTFTVNALPTITGNLTVGIGYTSQLKGSATAANVLPWESSNTSVATISNTGLVTAVSLGTSNITYTNTDGCQVSVPFTVSSLPTISGSLGACVGSTSQLTGSGTAAASSPWQSSNTFVATITSTGLVTALSVGTTSLTFTNSIGSQVTSEFTVNALPEVTGFVSACVSTTSQLSGSGTAALISPWASSNSLVATVNNTGFVSAISPGVATITYTNIKGCKVATAFTANALPAISGTLTGCVGSTSQLTGSATPAANLAWISSNASVVTVSITGLVTAVSAGTSTISYTNSLGCQRDVLFIVKQIPEVDQPVNVEFCNGSQTTVVGFSGNISGAVYNWTNSVTSIGLPGIGVGEIKSFAALNPGTSPVTARITVTPTANGCTGSPRDFTITVNPSPIVTFSLGNQTICSGDNTALVGLSSQSTGVEYSWTALEPAGITGVTKTGTNEIPVQTLVNSTNAPIIVIYEATGALNGALSCVGSKFSYKITVNPKPIVSAGIAAAICSGSPFTVSPLTGNGNIIPLGTTYTWDEPVIFPEGAISGGSARSTAQTSISQTLINNTTAKATATYRVTPKSGDCTGTPFEVVVTVNPTGKVIKPSDLIVCHDQSANVAFTTSNTDGSTAYSWSNSNPAIGLAVSGKDDLTFKAKNTGTAPLTANISVTPTYTNSGLSCAGIPENFVIKVNPLGQVKDHSGKVFCNGASVLVKFETTNTGGTTTYSWTNNLAGIGLDESGSGDLSFTANNTGLAPLKATITVTPTFTNGTESCQGPSKQFDITVNPAGQVNDIENLVVCNQQNTLVDFTSSNTGGSASYAWTNDNPGIGLIASGSGTLSFKAKNSTSSPLTATITVIPSFVNGNMSCPGLSKSFTISVNPSPEVTFSPANQIICSGEQSTLVNLESTTPDVDFTWESIEIPGISERAISGSNTIPEQTLVNSTNSPLDVIYKAKALVKGGGACAGAEFIYTITVKPKPKVLDLERVICSGESFLATPANNGSEIIPAGTTYTWDEPAISPEGALTGGSGRNNPQAVISQDLTNSTNGSGIATYSVTPLSGGCAGEPFNIRVTVNPEPTVDIRGNIAHCVGEQTAQIDFTGNVPGTVFSWTSSNTSIGIAESGIGNIPSFKTLNNGGTPVISTITVTPTFTAEGVSCTGENQKFTITVHPFLPVSVSITPDANNICPGTNVTFLATPVNGGLNPVWQWKVNGAVVDATEAAYIYAPAHGDRIECELISDAICPAGSPAQSNVVTMVVYSNLPARVSIIESANNVCPGESVTFAATPFNGGDNPVYQWYLNGVNTGANEPVYTYNPADGDEVSCRLTSANSCSESGIVLSNRIRMSVSMPAIIPLFEILQHNECAPIEVTFRNISPTNGNAYIWNFGDGETLTTATPVDVKHKFENFTASTRVFDVGLKIITSSTHCYIQLNKQLIVHPELIAGSPVNYTGCSPFVQKFENAYPGARSYRWITDKNTLLSTELQPTMTFTAPNKRDTTHIVYLIAESLTGCSDTIMNTIKVSPALEMPSFTYSGKADCRSVTYTFKNTSPEGAQLFTWDFDDGTINTTYHANETITHTFLNGTDEPVPFNVTLTSSSGKYCSISVRQKIVVESGYTAGYPVTFQGCSPMIRQFENAFPGSASYQWRSSNNVLLSEEGSPTLTFKALNGRDSTHLIYLIARSVNGCIDTIVNKVVVRAANKASFTAVPTEGCAPLTVQFSNTSSSKTNSYEWDFKDGSDISVIDSPVHLFLESDGSEARYNVSLIAFNQYGCADTAYHEIHLLPTPQVEFTALPIEQIYPSRTVQLNNLTPAGNWTYTWNFGEQKSSVTGLVNSHDYDLPGEYVISLTANGELCENTRRIRVAILPGTPVASFEPDTAGCAPLRVNFRNNSQNGSHYTWDFGNGSNSVDFSPSITYYNEGIFTVKLSVFNQFGVMSETSRLIVIHPVPKALFKPLPYRVKIPGQTVTFFNYSENASDYRWDFGDGNFSEDIIPVHQYTRTGIFDITLYITSLEGCKDTFLLPAAVDAFSDGLKVPNAFMPDKEGFSGGYYESGDPCNHIFYPAVAIGDLVEYELRIYNRWGNLLFTSQEAERGWDGYYNGRLCPQDVYIWKIRCKFKSGSVVTKTGDVTLLQ